VSDYNKGFLSERDIEFICESNDCVFLDTKKLLGDWCRNAKFIKINIHELEKTAHTVSDEIADKIIVTLGSGGCEFDGVVYPVEEVQMKDSSGAGDTFIAALAAKYVQTSNIEESLRFANQCATIVVQKRGVGTV
jgi:sugar/nucleoside kinase (ribokinase family)